MKPRTENRSKWIALRRSPRLLGESGLRRSPRLHGKSVMTLPKQTASPRKPCKIPAKESITMPESLTLAKGKSAMPKSRNLPSKGNSAMPKSRNLPSKGKPGITMPELLDADPGMTYCPYGGIEKIMRVQRLHEASHFKKMYRFQNDCPENKTCILPCDSSNWNENSFGIPYVAIRGRHITCVAFKKTLEPIRHRLGGYLAYNHEKITFDLLGTTIVSEIEVGEDNPRGPSTKIPCLCCGHVHKRFAIVSVVSNAENVDKVAAVRYLKDIMARDEELYLRESEKTVIAALQILWNEEFKPEDIWVHTASLGEEECMKIHEIKHRLNLIKNNLE